MTEGLDCSFELLQVRDGFGAQEAYRGGRNGTETIGTEEAMRAGDAECLCKAEEGARKRTNADECRDIV